MLAPVLALVVAWPALAPTDPDYWWHARTGQLIAETGAVPHADVFSYTAAGQPWITHEWLTELAFYAIQAHAGYAGNVITIGALGAAAALALYLTCRWRGAGHLTAAVLVLWSYGMALGSFGVRPQALSRVLLTVVALLLTRYRLQHDPRLLWALPPLMAVWANLHGGFAIRLGLLGLVFAGELLEAARTRSLRCRWPLGLATLASVAASSLTPNGLAGLLYPLGYAVQGYAFQQLIAEWQPPDLRQLAFAPFGLSLLLALGLGLARRPLGLVEVLWAIVCSVLALQSVRNIQLYATVVLPLIGARLSAEWPAFGRTLADWRRPRRIAALWTLASLVCAGVLGVRLGQTAGWQLQLGAEPSTAALPVGGLAFVHDHGLGGNLFTQFEWGGYVIYAAYPAERVFVDGRPDMYGPRVLDDYWTVVNLLPDSRAALDRYQVQLVLIDRDGPLAAALAHEPGWQELFAGPVERLFQRRAAAR